MSQRSKQEKILELLERGVTDPRQIARRCGFKGNALQKGLELIDSVIKTRDNQKTLL